MPPAGRHLAMDQALLATSPIWPPISRIRDVTSDDTALDFQMQRTWTLLPPTLALALLGFVVIATWHAVFGPWTFAHDEGLTGLTAVNVLDGLLPHVDFVDPYTGGAAFLHSLMYRIFGVGVVASRYALFAASLLLAAALFALTRSEHTTTRAAFASAMGLAWGPVVYMTALPSWYNLTAMAIGAAFLLHGWRSNSYACIVIAGVFAGLSLLAKSTGVYFCLSAVLFLASRGGPGQIPIAMRLTAALVAFLFVFLLTFRALSPSVLLYLLSPVMAIAYYVTIPKRASDLSPDPRRIFKFIAAFSIGIAAVILPWLALYAWNSGLNALWHGMVVLPSSRLEFATRPLPPVATSIGAVICVVVFIARTRLGTAARRYADLGIATLLLIVLAMSREAAVYQWVWNTVRWLLPFAAISYFVARSIKATDEDQNKNALTDLLWMATAFGSLIQFPFSFPLYFAYIAPLFVVTVFLTVIRFDQEPGILPWVLAGFMGFFCIHTVHGSNVSALGRAALPPANAQFLDLPRIRLPAPEYDQAVYQRIADLAMQHGNEHPILAYPDCPEVPFFSGTRSVLRSPYRFMAPEEVDAVHLQQGFDQKQIYFAVLNKEPEFSPPINDVEYQIIADQLPNVEDVGHFRVMWRGPSVDVPSAR